MSRLEVWRGHSCLRAVRSAARPVGSARERGGTEWVTGGPESRQDEGEMNPMPEEMIDLLRDDGTPLGRAKEKSLVHRDGDLHRTAHLWIVTPEAHVLLQLRASTKVNHPSLWDVSVAGHVDAGETAIDAAIREAREELGIALAAGELVHIGSVREQWSIEQGGYVDNEVQEVYVVRRRVELGALVLQPSEVDDVALVSFDEFRERVARRDATIVGHWEEYALVIAALERANRAD